MYNNYFFNKIILVTGGGSGIGRGLCLQLTTAGATVICTDIDPGKAAETVSLTGSDKALAKKLDVACLQEFETIVNDIITQHGRIDLVFNNAGIAVSGEIRDIGATDWKRIIDINFYGVLNGSQTAYHHMISQGSGHIVNIASGAGLVDYLVLMAPYSVTKHAVVNYTKLLRAEAKSLGVKASVVCPGFIKTSIGVNAIAPNAKQSWNNTAIKMVEKGIGVDKAAGYILKGVARNKEVIIFPSYIKLLLLFTRLFKGLHRAAVQKQLKVYRKNYRIS